MKSLTSSTICLAILFLSYWEVNGQEKMAESRSDTEYPDYITRVTDFGERADWKKKLVTCIVKYLLL